MERTLKYIQLGLGPIGRKIVAFASERAGLTLAAAIDVAVAMAGRDAGEIAGIGPMGVSVTADAEVALSKTDAEIAVVSTVSSAAGVEEQIRLCLDHGLNVVSSSEELAFPWEEHPNIAARIDRLARAAGLTVLATGVNPGLLMDTLPITLTGVCRRVDAIHIVRDQDASQRRLPFQQKIGAGLTVSAFGKLASEKRIRHVGFFQSIQMIAKNLGWRLDRTEDTVSPMVADRPLESPHIKVAAGQVSGIRQTGRGFMGKKAVITLTLTACLGHPSPKDAIRIEGDPPLYSEIAGGVNGDIATCAMVVNAIPRVVQAAAGLKTMPEIAAVSWYEGIS